MGDIKHKEEVVKIAVYAHNVLIEVHVAQMIEHWHSLYVKVWVQIPLWTEYDFDYIYYNELQHESRMIGKLRFSYNMTEGMMRYN